MTENSPDNIPDSISDKIDLVRQRIAAAAGPAGRDPASVKLIGVSKTMPVDRIVPAVAAGILDLGENRVQEAESKVGQISAPGLRWHLIGPLQSNKAKRAVQIFDIIHTVDSLKLAQRLDRLAEEEAKRLEVLIQVDLGKEPTKSGIDESELEELAQSVGRSQHLRLAGLMAIPPNLETAEAVRPYFRRLRELLDELNAKGVLDHQIRELSMGMSHDFEVAIEEGATMVRVGTAIFGARPQPV